VAHKKASKEAPADGTQHISPQKGPQIEFSACTAEILIYGGQAGGGKSWALVYDPLQYVGIQGFEAVIFRRTIPEIKMAGGLWDEAERMYTPLSPEKNITERSFQFGGKGSIRFSHLQYEDTRFDFQGYQICYLGFDELTHFTEKQFWYLISRNRSTCGIYPHTRATTNPNADSWVRKLIAWWINPETGYAIPERSGKIRWIVRRDNGEIINFATKAEATAYADPLQLGVKSLTFIHASLKDNPILQAKDPGYEMNLKSQDRVERERLLGGNWNIKYSGGNVFKRNWFKVVNNLPADIVRSVRYWDLAATEDGGDWTVGVKEEKDSRGYTYISDVARGQWSPHGVESEIMATSKIDGENTEIWIEQEGGSSGKIATHNIIRMLAPYRAYANRKTGSKLNAARPLAAQIEAGNVFLLKGDWNDIFINEVVSFSGSNKETDDQVDAASGAFQKVNESESTVTIL